MNEQCSKVPSVADLMDDDGLEVVSTMIIGSQIAVLIIGDEVVVADQSGEHRYKLEEEQ